MAESCVNCHTLDDLQHEAGLVYCQDCFDDIPWIREQVLENQHLDEMDDAAKERKIERWPIL